MFLTLLSPLLIIAQPSIAINRCITYQYHFPSFLYEVCCSFLPAYLSTYHIYSGEWIDMVEIIR